MAISTKYGRTYHFPFSPGTSSDDRINYQYWEDICKMATVIHTEKLDGENTCLNKLGVFARSHAAPTQHPWANYLKEKWHIIRHDLGDLEIFGENLYAIHSIEYLRLEHHFYVFAIREQDCWLGWEETKFYAALMDFAVVPELAVVQPMVEQSFEEQLLALTKQPSTFGSIDIYTGKACTKEGIVTRNIESYAVADFPQQVFKYVRKGHVKTDQHWTRNWKRAPLLWERRKSHVEDQ